LARAINRGEYRFPENHVLMGWREIQTGEERHWRCSALRHMYFDRDDRDWAARGLANMGFFEPDDPFGLIEPLTALALRYEDHPAQREAGTGEITALLTTYLTRAPWPKGPLRPGS